MILPAKVSDWPAAAREDHEERLSIVLADLPPERLHDPSVSKEAERMTREAWELHS